MTKFLSHFGKLWDAISSNVIFLLEFVGIIAAIFVIAYVVERAIKKRNNDTGKILTTRKVAVIGVMSAISGILMCFEIPLWFAPPFYKLDFSELPVLICGFAFGPVAGVLAEAVKHLSVTWPILLSAVHLYLRQLSYIILRRIRKPLLYPA